MKKEIDKAIDFCIDALSTPNDNRQEALGNDAEVLDVIKKIADIPYKGRGLGIGALGYKGYRSSWKDIYERFEGKKEITHPLDWCTAALLLYDFADYTEEEILNSAQKITYDDIIYNHILIHIITNLVIRDKIEKAEKYTAYFRKTKIFKENDNVDKGFLIILTYYALKGDQKNFFKYFTACKPSINRSEVNDAKQSLVTAYADAHGVEAAINLCRHKNLGTKYHSDAIITYAVKGKYQELKEVFNKYPELKQHELETELSMLISAYENAKIRKLPVDDDFEILFERAKQVDRKLRRGDGKLQDELFLNLGLASQDNPERVKRCRKAIKNNSLKKELLIP
ncbi:hypothetical protein MKJ01_13105 [Chryseobacterium sp. SSA4.19]|uniref:hypothetical protein n=1 Tax=Chryseobacterium sp. SSA4.19 TaxID=2919915 RepID=UPI001F4E1FB6|nr:hypothetical protein [Chryseobacterium sp. SSA4.19]MCJ8154703.1 hypothetical protein [Chryseobacterium sp. SSA4.19]